MWSLIRLLGSRKTVVLATEGYHEAKTLCEDIVLMADGSVIASGSFEELEARLADKGTTLEAVYYSLSGKEVRE